MSAALRRLQRQFDSGNGSFEAPNGIIYYRVDCRDLFAVLKLARAAQGIAAGTDETLQAAQPEGQEPGPKDAPKPYQEGASNG